MGNIEWILMSKKLEKADIKNKEEADKIAVIKIPPEYQAVASGSLECSGGILAFHFDRGLCTL